MPPRPAMRCAGEQTCLVCRGEGRVLRYTLPASDAALRTLCPVCRGEGRVLFTEALPPARGGSTSSSRRGRHAPTWGLACDIPWYADYRVACRDIGERPVSPEVYRQWRRRARARGLPVAAAREDDVRP